MDQFQNQSNVENLNSEAEIIVHKREQFRNQIRHRYLNNFLSQNRVRFQTLTPSQCLEKQIEQEPQLQVYRQPCAIHNNAEDCKFHDLYTTIEIFTYGTIDAFILRRQVEYQQLQEQINTRKMEKYNHLFHIAKLTKIKITINNGKYRYCYGRSYQDSLNLIQKGELYSLDYQYIIKPQKQSDLNLQNVTKENEIQKSQMPQITNIENDKNIQQQGQQICMTCLQVFKNIRGLKQHMTKKHKGKSQKQPPQIFEEHSLTQRFKKINKRGNINTETQQLRIVSWNTSSIKYNTFKLIKEQNPHIICLQEIRNHQFQNSPNYNYFTKYNSSSRSGGIAIGVLKCFDTANLEQKLKPPVKNCEYLCINLRNQTTNILLLNFYFHKGQEFKQCFNCLKLWFIDLLSKTKHGQIIIICGDFNVASEQIPGFKNIIEVNQKTFQRSKLGKLIQSRTDHILFSHCLKYETTISFNDHSDHALIKSQTTIPSTENKKQQVIIFHKTNAYKLNQKLANCYTDFTCWYHKLRTQLRSAKVLQKIRITLPKQQEYKQTLETKLKEIAENFNIAERRKRVYKQMKSITILNPKKKDGGLYRCYMDKDDNIFYPPYTIRNCLDQLSLLSNRKQFQRVELPTLYPLSIEEVKELQGKMSKDKAITRDGISDSFLKYTSNIELISNIWNNNILETNIYLCEARIIPLNKVYPQIPNENQFRPIVVLSPLYKFLELRFIQKLNNHCQLHISHYQNGFIQGKNTQINIKYVLNLINSTQKQAKLDLIFVDFQCAYNTIIRKRLYRILKEKNILTIEESDFLEKLHKNTYYQDPINNKCKYWFSNGVVQGSPISPQLFNIYLDNYINDLQNKTGQMQFKYLAYADDIVFWTQHKNIEGFLRILEQISLEWNLKINKKKSAIMFIKNHSKIVGQEILGYPIQKEYTYLGIEIKSNGQLKNHINSMQRKVLGMTSKLKWICQFMIPYQKITIWQLFINSILNYSEEAMKKCKFKGSKNQFQKLRVRSIKSILQLPKSTSTKIIEMFIKCKNKSNLPANVTLLFQNSHKICCAHNTFANGQHLIKDHFRMNVDTFYDEVFFQRKSKKEKQRQESWINKVKHIEMKFE